MGYLTGDDHESLVVRPKDVQDNATPSGSAMATMVLFKCGAYTGEARYVEAGELLEVVFGEYRPNQVVAYTSVPTQDSAIPLLRDRPQIGGKATAYVCQNFACQMPVTEAVALTSQL